MTWNDERVETLRAMWADGKSASQIAKELGGITRNAVIGKVHRLGLSQRGPGGAGMEDGDPAAAAGGDDPAAAAEAAPGDRDEPAIEPAAPGDAAEIGADEEPRPAAAVALPGAAAAAPAAASEISAEVLANLAEVERKAKRLTLMQLTERTCKWPVGDPATDEFWFCGLPSSPGKPYCEAHVAVAFQPMSSRRDRRGGGR
jgi:GcrA cell cycle regulator